MPLGENLTAWGKPALDLCLLTWASGVLDALSYLRAGVFTANMTGNTVVLGLAIVRPERSRVPFAVLSLSAFALGALMVGMLLVWRKKPRDWSLDLRAGLFLEVPLVAAFSMIWAISPSGGPFWVITVLIATAACALGIQSVAVRQMHISGVATTFITGTLTKAIVLLLEEKPLPTPGAQKSHSPLLLAGMFVLYILAAVCGGLLAAAKNPAAAIPALAAMLFVLIRARKP